MSTDEYTPTTETVRAHYVKPLSHNEETAEVRDAEFERFLAARDAEVAERIAQAITRELGDGRAADIARSAGR